MKPTVKGKEEGDYNQVLQKADQEDMAEIFQITVSHLGFSECHAMVTPYNYTMTERDGLSHASHLQPIDYMEENDNNLFNQRLKL